MMIETPVRGVTAPPIRGLTRSAQMRTALALVQRDLAVLFHSFPSFVVRTAMQPLLFAFVFAYVLPHIGLGIGGSGRGGALFASILLPGLMATSLMFQGIQAVALPLVQEFSFSREIEDRVMAPVPVQMVGLTKVISGSLQGIFAAVLTIPCVWLASGGAARLSWGHPLVLITMVLLGAVAGASLGLLIGTVIPPRHISMMWAVLLLPLTMLGCIYYPWSLLASLRWLQIAVLLNPLVYMSEGLRGALVPGVGHLSFWVVYALLTVVTAAMLVIGLRGFERRVIS